MKFSLAEVDPSWHSIFTRHEIRINEILVSLTSDEISPKRSQVFRAFSLPRDHVKAVIVGQDPYPGVGVADGLAFSSNAQNPIPASLRNILKEYSADLQLELPTSPDLSAWMNSGVLLLNRTLTTSTGERNAHVKAGWSSLTEDVVKELGADGAVGILWGNYAREFAKYFPLRIESVHPSPLSARGGFFGSKPFSSTNAILRERGKSEIAWRL